MTLNKIPLIPIIPIVKVNHGIANNFGSHIEINKNLIHYPHLLNPILRHEFSHTKKFFSYQDFKLDFLESDNINQKDMLKFMVKHPKSFTQLLPIYWSRKNGFVYDINLIVMYLIFGFVFITTIYFGGKYL